MHITPVTKLDPNGCFNKAQPDEPLFTLLARDPSAPGLVRKWADERERTNRPTQYIGDPEVVHPEADKIASARYVAARMEVWRYENQGELENGE